MNEAISLFGLMDDDAIPLESAALELSALDHNAASVSPHLELLAEMATRVTALGADAKTGSQQGEILSRVICGEYRFNGDHETYSAPINADMIRVFDRRRGLPIAIGIIYVAVARRAGWSATILNMPSHVVVEVGADEPVLLDVFNGGIPVDLDRLGAGLAYEGEVARAVAQKHLRMTSRDVLIRLLNNLAARAEEEKDPDAARAVYERMTLIAPGATHGWWGLARSQLMTGSVDAARASLTSLLEVTQDVDLRAKVTSTLDQLTPR